jgi:hypothetical protein
MSGKRLNHRVAGLGRQMPDGGEHENRGVKTSASYDPFLYRRRSGLFCH